jgi:hypothetical protein
MVVGKDPVDTRRGAELRRSEGVIGSFTKDGK